MTQTTDLANLDLLLAVLTAAKLAAAAGALAAVAKFRRGEYLHTAWLLLAAQMIIFAVKDLLFGRIIHLPSLTPASCVHLRTACSIAGNFVFIVGVVMLARVWRVAGFELPGSRAQRAAVTVLAVVVSTLVVGYASWSNLARLTGGDRDALVSLASNVGDIVGFSLLAPLIFVALALRGGALAWPWGLLVCSEVAWMVFDVLYARDNHLFRSRLGIGTMPTEALRVLACLLGCAAGLAQRRAIAPSGRRRP